MLKMMTLALCMLSFSACTTVKSPMLWKIERDGKESYLFGTVHSGVAADQLPHSVFQRLNASHIFISEIDHSDSARDEAAGLFDNERRTDPNLPEDSPGLDQLLSSSSWQELLKFKGKYSESELKRLKPFMAVLNYSIVVSEQNRGHGESVPKKK